MIIFVYSSLAKGFKYNRNYSIVQRNIKHQEQAYDIFCVHMLVFLSDFLSFQIINAYFETREITYFVYTSKTVPNQQGKREFPVNVYDAIMITQLLCW